MIIDLIAVGVVIQLAFLNPNHHLEHFDFRVQFEVERKQANIFFPFFCYRFLKEILSKITMRFDFAFEAQ